MNSRKDIDDFLRRKRVAVVGVSRDPKDFTRALFRELQVRGYDAVPVNPALSEVDGVPCFARVGEVTPPAAGALRMTRPAVTEEVVRECAAAHVETVWMYRAAGEGAVSAPAAAFCREQGIRVIEGECPFMFRPDTGLPHRVHGFVRKVFGKYPK